MGVFEFLNDKNTRERTIHLAADTIQFDSMQKNIGRYDTDTIRLLNCLLC